MTLEQYIQLDWSYVTWALLLLGMVLTVIAIMTATVAAAVRSYRVVEPKPEAVRRETPRIVGHRHRHAAAH